MERLLLKQTGLEGCSSRERREPCVLCYLSQFKSKCYVLVPLHVSLVPA